MILDFESLKQEVMFTQVIVPGVYSEDGFTLTTPGPGGFAAYGTMEPRFSGSTALIINSNENPMDPADPRNTATLVKDDAGSFALRSIDLTELNGPNMGSVTFIAQLTQGGTTMQTFVLDGDANFTPQTFLFDNTFSDILSVTWSMVDQSHQFDNIVLSDPGTPTTVPEPSSSLLFGLGGLSLVSVAIRRRRQAC